ncbi:MAG: patatin-like phospholipase family protein [Bacteroidaceae bacterium]|nr:patatin-like phospholipase family protein [Bacteroidaceae bacterium]
MMKALLKILMSLSIVPALTLTGQNVLYAQTFANNLAASSVDPVSDSIALAGMRARLDSIRTAGKRPTVAVVLSGGGAKGAAYIGIFRYLEEQGIPVDMLCGTSMGGLIGGLYSMGYDSHELEEIFRSIDWTMMMSDDIDMKFLPMDQKMYKFRYVLSIPFFYDDAAHSKRTQLFDAPLGDNDLQSTAGQKGMLSLIPSGYISGFNVENMLSNLTVGFHDDMQFKDLPIPFYCVSSDLVSAKAKYHTGGSVTKAIRSTISIPGVFTPVRYDSRILVDGGTRNNFPVDIARAAGADIVIGIEVAKRGITYSEVNNVVDVVNCMITMLGDDARSNEQAQPDVFIKPDTGGKSMLSFNSETIAEMIDYGYNAAVARKEDFDKIKAQFPDTVMYSCRTGKKAMNLYTQNVRVSGIMVNGIDRDEQSMFRKILDLKGHQELSADDIKDAMSRIMASGSFETVNYSLLKDEGENTYRLVFDCVPGKIHHFGVSARLDTEEFAELMLNLRLNAHKLKGWHFDVTGKVSTQASLDLTLSHIPDNFAQFNLRAAIKYGRADIKSTLVNQNYDLNSKMLDIFQELYFSTIHAKSCDIRAGLRHENIIIPAKWMLFTIPDDGWVDPIPEYYSAAHYLTAFFHADFNTVNDRQFPTRGFVGGAGFEYDIANFSAERFPPVPILNLDAKFYVNVTKWLCLIPDLSYRGYFADCAIDEQEYSIMHNNFVGGSVKGRYVGQQKTFVGFGNMAYARNQAVTANLDMRFKLAKKLYLSALLGAIRDKDYFSELFSGITPTCWGCGMEVAYRTFVGPVKANIHWNDSGDRSWGYYISAGFDF